MATSPSSTAPTREPPVPTRGEVIRALRGLRCLTLRGAARHTRIALSTISKLERDQSGVSWTLEHLYLTRLGLNEAERSWLKRAKIVAARRVAEESLPQIVSPQVGFDAATTPVELDTETKPVVLAFRRSQSMAYLPTTPGRVEVLRRAARNRGAEGRERVEELLVSLGYSAHKRQIYNSIYRIPYGAGDDCFTWLGELLAARALLLSEAEWARVNAYPLERRAPIWPTGGVTKPGIAEIRARAFLLPAAGENVRTMINESPWKNVPYLDAIIRELPQLPARAILEHDRKGKTP